MKLKNILGLSFNASLILGGVVIVSNHLEAEKAEWLRGQFVRWVCEAPGKVPADIRCAIFHHAERPDVVAAIAYQESGFKRNAISKAGACGLMQFMPRTAREEGVDCFDIISSIKGAERYLNRLEKQFRNFGVALAAYNYGAGNMQKWIKGGSKPDTLPVETRNYVKAITGHPISYWLAKPSNITLAGHIATIGKELRQ